MPQLLFEDLQLKPYQEAHGIQQSHFDRLIEAKKNGEESEDAGVFIICEHPPVYTLGRNGSEDNLIANKSDMDAEVHRIGRGGDITFHGPGQLVGYPILDLEKWPMGLAKFVHSIEEVIIRTLDEYGVKADRTKEAPGVWIDFSTSDARKIAALGIQSSRWVTMHGFAFNINTNLEYFGNIIPCGIPDKEVTSLSKELGKQVSMNEVKERVKFHFQTIFEADWKSA